jgi:hypothetical protein
MTTGRRNAKFWELNRPEHLAGRVVFGPGRKNLVISGRENPTHDRPTGHVGPQFSARA